MRPPVPHRTERSVVPQPPEVQVVVFDVNETLSDMAPLGERFADIGADSRLAAVWFASLLRDGFALAATGDAAPFREIGRHVLHSLLSEQHLDQETAGAVDHILNGFASLDLHRDVPTGLDVLTRAGLRLVTLSNGSADVAEGLFDRGGVREHFEQLLSVQDAPAWKPAAAAYRYAADQCDVKPEHMLLVAVHPWDIHGAHAAGMRTAWINRTGSTYPQHFTPPDLHALSLLELARQLRH